MHALTSFLAAHDRDITEHQQFDDVESGRLFLGTCFESANHEATVDDLKQSFGQVAAQFQMEWQLQDAAAKERC